MHTEGARENGDDNDAPHDEHAGHGDDQTPEFFDRTEPDARIEAELEIQQDETGRDRQQVGRDIDAVAQIELNEQKPDGDDRGGEREDIDQQQRQAVDQNLDAVAQADAARERPVPGSDISLGVLHGALRRRDEALARLKHTLSYRSTKCYGTQFAARS